MGSTGVAELSPMLELLSTFVLDDRFGLVSVILGLADTALRVVFFLEPDEVSATSVLLLTLLIPSPVPAPVLLGACRVLS